MKLKSFGCSFTFGSELADCCHDNKVVTSLLGRLTTHSQLTWPALLANKLNYDYECYARPGTGNLQILEQLLTQCSQNDLSFVVVNWTWINRFDYYAESLTQNPWKTIRPVDDSEVAKTYYRCFHSEFKDKLTNLIYIKTAIDILCQKNIKFLMTTIDPLIFDIRWHCTPAIVELQNYVKPFITFFNDKTFLSWSQDNNYKIGENGHPLEDAHREAAEYMIKVFDTQKTNDPTQQVRV